MNRTICMSSTTNTPVEIIDLNGTVTDNSLQTEITNLLQSIVEAEGKFTLAELGYLHSSSFTYSNDGQASLKVFFNPTVSCRLVNDRVQPVSELNAFSNYLFYGNVADVIKFAETHVPKHEVKTDTLGRASVRIVDNTKMVKTKVAYIECNITVTLAAITDSKLTSPNFSIECATVTSKSTAQTGIVYDTSNKAPAPLRAKVVKDVDTSFDPDEVYAYLLSLQTKSNGGDNYKGELKKKAVSKSEKKNDKRKKKHDKAFAKYS